MSAVDPSPRSSTFRRGSSPRGRRSVPTRRKRRTMWLMPSTPPMPWASRRCLTLCSRSRVPETPASVFAAAAVGLACAETERIQDTVRLERPRTNLRGLFLRSSGNSKETGRSRRNRGKRGRFWRDRGVRSYLGRVRTGVWLSRGARRGLAASGACGTGPRRRRPRGGPCA